MKIKGNDCRQTVNLRELTEMQPEKRLEKLISKRRFDEAEAFAKQFGLDLQVGK